MNNHLPNSKRKGLKRLGPVHHQIVALHLEGRSNNEIAASVNRSPTTVSIILNDPLVEKFIMELVGTQKTRLSALTPLAVDGIRENLTRGSLDQKLKASKVVLESQGLNKPNGEEDTETAEDVAKRIINQVNLQVNVDGKTTETKVIEESKHE